MKVQILFYMTFSDNPIYSKCFSGKMFNHVQILDLTLSWK